MHRRNVKQENAVKLAVHKYWRKENEDVSLTGGLAENSSLSESMSFSRAGPSLAAHAYTFPSSVTSDTSTCEWVGTYYLVNRPTIERGRGVPMQCRVADPYRIRIFFNESGSYPSFTELYNKNNVLKFVNF